MNIKSSVGGFLPFSFEPAIRLRSERTHRLLQQANATTLEEVLAAVSCADSSFSSGNIGFDYQLPEEVRHRMSVFCRIPASKIAELEIRNVFVGHRPEWFFARQTTPYRPHLNHLFACCAWLNRFEVDSRCMCKRRGPCQSSLTARRTWCHSRLSAIPVGPALPWSGSLPTHIKQYCVSTAPRR